MKTHRFGRISGEDPVKLTQKKPDWIIWEKRKGVTTNRDIALAMELSVPYVKKIWKTHRGAGTPAVLTAAADPPAALQADGKSLR